MQINQAILQQMSGTDRIVRPKEASIICARSTVQMWRDERDGKFPRRIRLGANSCGYKLSELNAWIERRRVETDTTPVKPVAPGVRRGRRRKAVVTTEETD